jgi:hypothetical protein
MNSNKQVQTKPIERRLGKKQPHQITNTDVHRIKAISKRST